MQRLLYTRYLTRVAWLVCEKGESVSWKSFRSAFLPEPESVEPPLTRTYAWRLAPFWKPHTER